ncbi:hypothetical protein PV08_02425 [Exophiala spinifera]|uniref:Uncharacterized protein n=1 Tax=Exophiala spinifera TaxID=91928 RepID=A0A0D1ZZJ8_9EURO|nr:uncharacterized protein PV08_02425 [Exophiala spinifera]KIW18137.1 hypothetical protein PV08_02425 [Exophiala spinifera]
MAFSHDASTSSSHLQSPPSRTKTRGTMDQELEARRMTAASVRRRTFQERRQLNNLEQEHRAENKRHNKPYDSTTSDEKYSEAFLANYMATDKDRFERESSVETPSECSVLTPGEPRQDSATFGQPSILDSSTDTPLKLEIPDHEDVMQVAMEGTQILIPPSPQPAFQASLASWSDFQYDRYSMMLSSPVTSEIQTPDLEDEETFSPIETATPVSFRQPRARPSLISIVSSPHRSKRRNTSSAHSPLSQEVFQPPKRAARRPSSSSSLTGFPAAEATLFEVPDLPANAIEMIASASQDSLLLSSFSSNQARASTLRKSSVPRLPSALNHSRVSSTKSLVRTPPFATHARTFSGASSHRSRPSTASISGGVEATPAPKKPASYSASASRASAMLRRPSTAMSVSSSDSHSHGIITALPSVPISADEDSHSDNTRSMQRKKSFQNLRRRSESIHQAIKGLGKITTRQDTPAMPSISTPYPEDPSRSPVPPLPSARTGKGSVRTPSFMSTFSRSSNGSGIVGLGLRNI